MACGTPMFCVERVALGPVGSTLADGPSQIIQFTTTCASVVHSPQAAITLQKRFRQRLKRKGLLSAKQMARIRNEFEVCAGQTLETALIERALQDSVLGVWRSASGT